jgi:hypothetical protein
LTGWSCKIRLSAGKLQENFSDPHHLRVDRDFSCAASLPVAGPLTHPNQAVAVMKILGIQLSKPSFNEITASAIMAAGLWLAIVALWRVSEQPLDRIEAGAALLVVFWGCIGVRMGIRLDKGLRHLAANVLCGAAILAVYHGVMALFA